MHDSFANAADLEEEYVIHSTQNLDNDSQCSMMSVPYESICGYDDSYFCNNTRSQRQV